MIVTDSLAYYGPPKTGTLAVRNWLNGDMVWGHHDYVEERVGNRVVFCTIRNPYDRAASLWKHWLRENPSKHQNFDVFLETNVYWLSWPQVWWVREHDICLAVEELDIPTWNEIPDLHVPWTAKTLNLVRQRYRKDFELCREWCVSTDPPPYSGTFPSLGKKTRWLDVLFERNIRQN